jgi:cyanate permease
MVQKVVWPNYFGRRHMGSIVGVASLVVIAGSALGPMPMGIARDLLGSYSVALTASATLPLALGVAVLFTRRPQKRHAPAPIDA